MSYIDFHTHILPGIDDGAKDVSMSCAMLKSAGKSGANVVVCTPHFDAADSVETFLSRRNNAFSKLQASIREETDAMPRIILGAEVFLSASLSEKSDVNQLCIEGTDLILLEMPYPGWNKWHVQEVYHLIARNNVTPVIAHIDRYLKSPKDLQKLEQLVSIGAKFQVNADAILSFSGKRVVKALAKSGFIDAIGSDCHRTDKRTPDISHALGMFEKTFGADFLDDIYHTSYHMLNVEKNTY